MKTSTREKIFLCLTIISILFVFGVRVQEAKAQPYLNLPPGQVTLVVYNNWPISTFSAVLSNVPAGYDVTDGAYLSWCMEEFILLTPGDEYEVTLYSSYDPYLPAYLQDDDWDMVNYILNHKEGNSVDIQNATWYFVNGGSMPSSPEGQAMVNDALNNGEGFIPKPGQVVAVICDTGDTRDHPQRTFIEVEVPYPPVGGEILPVNVLVLVAPFLLLSVLVVGGIVGILFKRPLA